MNMHKILDVFEKIIVMVLLISTGAIILISTYELVVMIIRDVITISHDDDSLLFLNSVDLLNVFSFILLVIIGMELFETIKHYLSNHILQAEIILVVALTAISRKVIVLDYQKHEALTIIGMGILVFALAISYYLIRRANREFPEK